MASRMPDYESYDYSRTWAGKALEDLAEKEVVLSWVAGRSPCLELGGGFGRLTRALELSSDDVTMVDFSELNLSRARSALERSGLVRCDIGQLPFRDSAFRRVVMARVLHHFADPVRALAEVARVSSPDGEAVVSVPNTKTGRVRKLSGLKLVSAGDNGHRSYGAPLEYYKADGLERVEMKGTGLFDNFAGRALARARFLYRVDTLTSRAWLLKPHVFIRYRATDAGPHQTPSPRAAPYPSNP